MDDSDSDLNNSVEENFDDADQNDVFKIMLTTDNHLGYLEKDAERGNDSFLSFEECLEIAKLEYVDFILLGGDLFHENKPTRDCLTKCQKLFREHCFGTKPIEFEIISDENLNFGHTGFAHANFNDPNLNVSIPVFTIHGNHDDPTGAQNLCVMDTLAAAGLVNYFGKSNTACNRGIDITPILLEKGSTKLAIYGLGAIKDERLHHMFEKGMVQFVRPNENADEWFNIFVIHQNRSMHGKKNFIPEGFLPDFIDLVIWGHEHECRIRPEYNELQKFYVTQPGSSVITSLSESETGQKHVGLLKIYKKDFKLKPIPLRTVRQFVMDTVVLNASNLNATDKHIEAKIEQFLIKKIDKIVEECKRNRYLDSKQPIKPLIRLKVDYTDFETINENRFAQKMLDKVANPRNVLQFYKRQTKTKEEAKLDPEALKQLRMQGGGEQLEYVKVQDIVSKYFCKADEKSKLMVLTEKGLGEAIQEFIEKDEKDAIPELINFQIGKIQKYLKTEAKCVNDFQINEEIKRLQAIRLENQNESEEIKELFGSKQQTQSKTQRKATYESSDEEVATKKNSCCGNSSDEGNLDMDEDAAPTGKSASRGRGARGAKTARGTGRGRGRGRGRGAAQTESRTQQQEKLEFVSSSNSSKLKKEPDVYSDDEEIIELDNEKYKSSSKLTTTKTTGTRSQALETKSQNIKTSTTPSVRRTRIDYDDDENEDDLNELIQSSNKKAKTNTSEFNTQSQSSSSNTFSIFKKVANKKKF